MDKKDLTRVILGALVFLVSFFLTGTAQIVVCLIAYVICGYETIIESAVRYLGPESTKQE